MYMKDWLVAIDDYLRMTRRGILTYGGEITHEKAIEKAELEYIKYNEKQKNLMSKVEKDFLESISKLENLKKK